MRSVSVPRAGEHDDRHRRLPPQLAAHFPAVAVGQGDVEQDEAGVVAAEELERGAGGGGDDGLEALARERAGERLGDRALVLHEQDRRSGGLGHRAKVSGMTAGTRHLAEPLPAVARRFDACRR